MARNASVIAFNDPTVTANVLAVFTIEGGDLPQCRTPTKHGDNFQTETLSQVGQPIHPDLSRALNLSEQTGEIYSVTPCGVIKAVTHEEISRMPRWVLHAAFLSGVNPV